VVEVMGVEVRPCLGRHRRLDMFAIEAFSCRSPDREGVVRVRGRSLAHLGIETRDRPAPVGESEGRLDPDRPAGLGHRHRSATAGGAQEDHAAEGR
jgi:hypothetical protein